MGRRNGVVTWSPVVVSVSRPSRKKTAKKSLRPSVVSFKGRDIQGTLDGHFRGDTHSLLLTMREDGHRKLQFLIDLPKKRIRRVYDGIKSWNIVPNGGESCSMACSLGNIAWEDGEIRDMDSRGFRLDWLHGTHALNVNEAIKKRRDKARSSKHGSLHKKYRSSKFKNKSRIRHAHDSIRAPDAKLADRRSVSRHLSRSSRNKSRQQKERTSRRGAANSTRGRHPRQSTSTARRRASRT